MLTISVSCSTVPESKDNNLKRNLQTNKSNLLSDRVSEISSSSSDSIIEKLLDEELSDSSQSNQDSAYQVNDDETKFNDQDQAEDIVGKLLNDGPVSQNVESTFIPEKDHPLVQKWISFFTLRDRARFIRFMTNGAKYRDIIEKIFKEEGVPKELFFVGLIESGFFLQATSHASAVGPWQFIRATGKRYGLTVSRTLDERKDLFKSTRAAARYFRDLYRIFGSWELALSGYNAGEYGIMRRMKRGKTENFFSLATRGYLHPETANYVPKVMAAMHIYKHLSRYNFPKVEAENPFANTITINLKHSHSMRLIADTLELNLETLQLLNSELPTPYTPYIKNGSYRLRVPKLSFEQRGAELVAILKQTSSRTSSHTLARYEQPSLLKSRLRKSRAMTLVNRPGASIIRTNQPLFYIVQSGDTLSSLAQHFKVSGKMIMQENRLNKQQLPLGQKLRIPERRRTYYLVKRGDNLHMIAKKFELSAKFLKNLNNLDESDIYTGQKILVLL